MLDLTVREALTFFSSSPKVLRRLQVLDEIGLGYLRLGQPATTLSGGEAQRIKIAAHLSSHSGERLLYILDEPTTGLHFDDIAKLLTAFRKLLEAGHTLLVIEHNLDVDQDGRLHHRPGSGGRRGRAATIVAIGHARASGASRRVAHGPLPARRARRGALARVCVGTDIGRCRRTGQVRILIEIVLVAPRCWLLRPARSRASDLRADRRRTSTSPDARRTRLRAVEMLKDAAYPEAAIPLAAGR